MRKKIEWKWEKLDETTYRVKVIGGWLIGFYPNVEKSNKNYSITNVIFILDRDHEWEIMEEIKDEKLLKSNLANDFIR